FRINRSGPDGTTVFGRAYPLPTLPALSREDSVLVSGGAEAYVVVNALVNVAGEFTTESTYFSDVNGDGLPDLVQNGHVFFNHLVPDSNGVPIPTFVEDDSSATPVPVGQGAVDATGLVGDFEKEYQQQLQRFPLLDTLRRWVAPFDGRVQIAGNVALKPDTSPARQQYQTADGVRVAIQQNGGERGPTPIGATDHGPR